jgi:hypothetical protein
MAHYSAHPSYTVDSYHTSPPTSTSTAARDDARPDAYGATARAQQDGEQTVRKQTSLAHIHIPSFRSFASSIPVPSPSTTKRKPAPFKLARSPRAASFSFAEKASPRLAEPTSRPLSLDSPKLTQHNGQSGILSPPLTEEFTARQEDRYGAAVCCSLWCNTDTDLEALTTFPRRTIATIRLTLA